MTSGTLPPAAATATAPVSPRPGAGGPAEQLARVAAGRPRGRVHALFVLRTVPPYRLPFLARLAGYSPALDVTVVAADGVAEAGKLTTVADTHDFRLVRVAARLLEVWRFTLIWICLQRARLRELAPDVLVLEGSFGILSHVPLALWARATDRRVVFWVAGWTKPTTTGLAKRLRELYMRGALRLGHQFVCYSSLAAAWLVRLGAHPDTVRVAQNTIDVEGIAAARTANAAAAAALRTRLGIGDAAVLLYVGALTRDKRVDRLLAVHALLRARGIDVHTVVVGSGPEGERIAAQAAGDDHVHLVGRVVDGVDAYFAMADLFVLPGLGGLALNQAMASGVPVLCSEADGTERDLVIEGVTGHFRGDFAADEWAALAAAIITDPARRRAMGAAALAHVLRHASLGNMCDVFVTSFTTALDGAHRS